MGVSMTSGAVPAGAWTAISSGTGACDITGIPTGYKFLRLMIYGDSVGSSLKLTFNADGGAHYYSSNGAGNQTFITLAAYGGDFRAMASIDIANIPGSDKQITGSVTAHFGGVTIDAVYTPVTGTWVIGAPVEINRITVTGTPVYWTLFGAALP